MRGRAGYLGGLVVGLAILFGCAGSSMAAPQKTETCPICAKADEGTAKLLDAIALRGETPAWREWARERATHAAR